MVEPTFATAAGKNASINSSEHLRRLLMPAPTSVTLIASLQLLTSPLVPPHNVFLMTSKYLQNWLVWAYNQNVSKDEASRVKEAVRLGAIRHKLTPPRFDMNFTDPGPIDSTALSIQGHPLLLHPNVEVIVSSPPTKSPATGASYIRRAQSLNHDSGGTQHGENSCEQIQCCAVPEKFYETLRSIHGVLCDDTFSVSFQPFERRYEGRYEDVLIHHHELNIPKKHESESKNGARNKLPASKDSSSSAQPVEFRRKIILQDVAIFTPHPKNLMEKLMQEEQRLKSPQSFPSVEVHPIRLLYSIISEGDGPDFSKSPVSHSGFVLISRDEPVIDALQALMKVATPRKATTCVRVWIKRSITPLESYELVHMDDLRDKEGSNDGQMMVCEWIRRHSSTPSPSQLELLVETRKTASSSWYRESLELENRIKVGDFVDAQDSTGKWYEALVRKVTRDTVTVHYLGWATKWDSIIRKRRNSKVDGVLEKAKSPAPLWSHSSQWRENLREKNYIEVRDSSSLALRPRWYKGEVKQLGRKNDSIRDMPCGAQLEFFEGNNGINKKAPLQLLNRTQQVLVEIAEERTRKALSPNASEVTDENNHQKSHLRWVNVYGEEICQIGTHLRNVTDLNGPITRPVTLRYDFDSRRAPVEIMKSANHGAGFVRESLRGIPPAPGSVGLHNLGNSCFLNSIVQCLNHVQPLSEYFLKDVFMTDLNKRNPLSSGGNVARAYASLQKKMWGGDYSILVPRLLKQTVANFAPQFDNSYQHDSHEFCQFLMDGLHEDLNRVKQKPYVEELEGFGMDDDKAAIESWRKHLLRHDSIIVDHCQGIHRSHLTCPVCGRESIKFDVYSSVSLPLTITKERQAISIQDCIEKFMEGEQLDELNAWYCPNCRKHVCALKMIALWSVPDVLILHLKRFTFDHCSHSGNVVRSKIDYNVDFPIEDLDLTKYILGPHDDKAPPVYKLVGVSEHSGKTANSGHYTATVRNSVDNKWYRCNDSHIGRTAGEASITGGAYLLFYKRAKGASKWGGLEKLMKEQNIDAYGGLEIDKEGFKKVKSKRRKPKAC